MELMKFLGRGAAAAGALLTCVLMVGCETNQSDQAGYKFDPLAANATPGATSAASDTPADPVATLLHVGDEIGVSFADTPSAIPPIDDTIKEDGSIVLIYNQRFQAAGKTIGTLQVEIHDRYVPQYFKYLTVSVRPQDRFFSVSGEVHSPNRNVYVGRTTVLRAITIAGGFTDFANKTHVQITRANGKIIFVNCKKALAHPELDLEIFPGDDIHVRRRLW